MAGGILSPAIGPDAGPTQIRADYDKCPNLVGGYLVDRHVDRNRDLTFLPRTCASSPDLKARVGEDVRRQEVRLGHPAGKGFQSLPRASELVVCEHLLIRDAGHHCALEGPGPLGEVGVGPAVERDAGEVLADRARVRSCRWPTAAVSPGTGEAGKRPRPELPGAVPALPCATARRFPEPVPQRLLGSVTTATRSGAWPHILLVSLDRLYA